MCGLYGVPPVNYNSDEKTKKIQNFLDSVGVVQQIEAPKHKEYASFETRLKTFDKCLKKLKQDTHTLCEAGFFYMGNLVILLLYFCIYCMYLLMLNFNLR